MNAPGRVAINARLERSEYRARALLLRRSNLDFSFVRRYALREFARFSMGLARGCASVNIKRNVTFAPIIKDERGCTTGQRFSTQCAPLRKTPRD